MAWQFRAFAYGVRCCHRSRRSIGDLHAPPVGALRFCHARIPSESIDQVSKNAEVAKQDRLNYLEEGKKTRQAIENERNKILRIKQRKLDKIGEMNVYKYVSIDLLL